MSERLPTYIISYGDTHEPPRELQQPRIWLGSHADCELRLAAHFTISPTHATVEWDGEHFILTDTDRANATVLNHRLIEYNVAETLASGDVVQIGPYLLTFKRTGKTLSIEVTRLLLASNFRIHRKDFERATEIQIDGREGLLICNPPDQQVNDANADKLILNHPKVSPVHAGINRLRDPFAKTAAQFYLIDLSPSNQTYLS